MISAGGGEGDHYAAVADQLCDEYKVIMYDRRANARSTMNTPQNFEISQQNWHAVAVQRAVSETLAFFGNSGAVIALDMTKTQSQSVWAVVVHEVLFPRVLPQARKRQRHLGDLFR
jgi:hypothetical protein